MEPSNQNTQQPTAAEWLDVRKRAAYRRTGADRAAARHRSRLRKLIGIPNAVRARETSEECHSSRLGTIVRVWAWHMAEVIWQGTDGREESWLLKYLAEVPEAERQTGCTTGAAAENRAETGNSEKPHNLGAR